MSPAKLLLGTPIPGIRLTIGLSPRGAINDISFLTAADPVPDDILSDPPDNTPARNIIWQLQRYFTDPSPPFTLPLDLTAGTPFQQRVWQALRAIPVGQTISYGALARQLGTAARAVGNACRANPLPIIVPCHRVIAAHGPGGYCGAPSPEFSAIKHWLLEHEHTHHHR
ncbi:MAG: methylated-DNA--[protein]-cysteine S-methyltransferase [Gammaproteobacteria bacterium]|nr:methylated-DNA--[protein]-cysteine S-methyltransferase [Gammaproteobacteria bacterium]